MTAPGIIVVRLGAPLFFANGSVFADAVKRAITAVPEGSVQQLVVDMEAVTDVDVTGAAALTALTRWHADRDITLSFSRMRPPTTDHLRHLGALEKERVFEQPRGDRGSDPSELS